LKKLLFIIAILGTASLAAQTPQDIQKDLFSHLKTDALILSDSGLLRGELGIEKFVSDFKAANSTDHTYTKDFGVEVNVILEYEIGKIETSNGSYPVMFLKNTKADAAPKIEFLVIYEESDVNDEASAIDSSRNKWMELCNAHDAGKLVEQVYVPDAYYYNRGRLLEGTKALSAEYGYMNSPSYSLKLTPKHITFVTSEIAYEIGQCSGSYPLPYMLVWEKQDNGKWLILMDSNY